MTVKATETRDLKLVELPVARESCDCGCGCECGCCDEQARTNDGRAAIPPACTGKHRANSAVALEMPNTGCT